MSAAEVGEALNTIQVIAADVAAAGANKAKATMISEGIEPIWARIEATVKANDKGSYETFEKGIEGVEAAAKAGDAAKASGSAGVIASAAKFYGAKFPADAKAAADPVAGDRTAAAASTAPAENKAKAEPPARAADAAPAPAAAPEPGDATLVRTGTGSEALMALAGTAFGLGGLAIVAGARRRRLSPTV